MSFIDRVQYVSYLTNTPFLLHIAIVAEIDFDTLQSNMK